MWFIDLMLDSMFDYCARTQIPYECLSCSTAGQDFIVLVNVEMAMVRIFNIIQMPTTH